MQERKSPPPLEQSVSYISWALKDLVKEIKDLTETLKNFKQQKDAF